MGASLSSWHNHGVLAWEKENSSGQRFCFLLDLVGLTFGELQVLGVFVNIAIRLVLALSIHCFLWRIFCLPTVSPLACFAFEAGFHSLKLDLVLALNSSESHSGLDATAAREIQLVRGPLWGNSYSFWFIPSFCGAFALPGMGFYTEHIVTSSWFLVVPKGRCCLMTPTYYACGSFSLLCKPTCPSFLSSGFLWCPSQELPAGQLYNGNALVPGKVLLCGMAAETLRILYCNQYSTQFRLNIGKIVLPYTGNMFKCCGTSLRRCSNPCYIGRAD